jgi:hypothetical protein
MALESGEHYLAPHERLAQLRGFRGLRRLKLVTFTVAAKIVSSVLLARVGCVDWHASNLNQSGIFEEFILVMYYHHAL